LEGPSSWGAEEGSATAPRSGQKIVSCDVGGDAQDVIVKDLGERGCQLTLAPSATRKCGQAQKA